MRHGEDNDSGLGVWSDAGLSQKGKEHLAHACKGDKNISVFQVVISVDDDLVLYFVVKSFNKINST